MNRINKILTSCYLFVLIIVISNGCATLSDMPRDIQIVTAYQSMGATLEEAKPVILALCANSTLDKADCAEAKRAYNQAVTLYKTLGDAADQAIDTGDQTRVRQLTVQLKVLLMYLSPFLVTQ